MEGVPATNRWPRWARRLLWGVFVAALLLIGAFARDIPDDLMRMADAIGGNADRAEATQAFVLIFQTIVIVAGALYARQQLHATRAISARTNTLQLIFEEHRDRTVADYRAIYRDVRDDEHDRMENYFDFKEYRQKIRADWDEKRASGIIRVVVTKEAPTDPEEAREAQKDVNEAAASAMHALIEAAWADYWKPIAERWVERRKAVSAVLNRYEAFAIGIEKGAVDEEMYRLWWKTNLIEDWYVFRPLINKLQQRNPRAYLEFQSLAERWQKETTKELRDTRRGAATW